MCVKKKREKKGENERVWKSEKESECDERKGEKRERKRKKKVCDMVSVCVWGRRVYERGGVKKSVCEEKVCERKEWVRMKREKEKREKRV